MEKIVCPAKIDNLYRVSNFVKSVAESTQRDIQFAQLDLVVEEIFINIVSYAYEGSVGEVEIQCGMEADMFLLCFVDRGTPFDMTREAAPDITGTAKERPVGGLGIFFVKEIMDYVNYKYKDGANILTVGMNATIKQTNQPNEVGGLI